MKIKDLIERLKEFPDDTEVTVWADHGQLDFKCEYVSKAFIHKDEWEKYMMEGTHSDDIEDKEDYIEICQLS